MEGLREAIRNEGFANHMGVALREIGPGYAAVEARYSENMVNFNGLVHGGAIFSLIDEAFAVASNSHGTVAVALSLNVIYLESPRVGALLVAEAREQSRTDPTATYAIEVIQKDEEGDRKIAVCQALVYRKKETLSFLEKGA